MNLWAFWWYSPITNYNWRSGLKIKCIFSIFNHSFVDLLIFTFIYLFIKCVFDTAYDMYNDILFCNNNNIFFFIFNFNTILSYFTSLYFIFLFKTFISVYGYIYEFGEITCIFLHYFSYKNKQVILPAHRQILKNN